MTDEQIIAADIKPTGFLINYIEVSASGKPRSITELSFKADCPTITPDNYARERQLLSVTCLFSADVILSAVKPLRDEIERLKVERDQAWSVNPTTSEQLLRQQNAKLIKQLEEIKNAS